MGEKCDDILKDLTLLSAKGEKNDAPGCLPQTLPSRRSRSVSRLVRQPGASIFSLRVGWGGIQPTQIVRKVIPNTLLIVSAVL
jgi:hypothetical protein